MSIHLGVAPERARDAVALVRRELQRLHDEGPSETEVASARAQIRGSIVLSQESVSNRMSHVANDELYSGRYVTGEEQVRAVMAVTREQVTEAARAFLAPGRLRAGGGRSRQRGPARHRRLADRHGLTRRLAPRWSEARRTRRGVATSRPPPARATHRPRDSEAED